MQTTRTAWVLSPSSSGRADPSSLFVSTATTSWAPRLLKTCVKTAPPMMLLVCWPSTLQLKSVMSLTHWDSPMRPCCVRFRAQARKWCSLCGSTTAA